jgi:hypothetical protein
MRPQDTSRAAFDKQFEIHGAMGGGGRVQLALGLSDMMRELSLEGIRNAHPDWSRAEIVRAYAKDVLRIEIPTRGP